MNAPPLLIPSALLFWGWETGLLKLALCFAVLIEACRFLHWKWDFGEKDFYRVWDLCTLLFFGTAIYRYNQAQNQQASSPYLFFQWFPIFFLPMILAQICSVSQQVPAKTFSWFLRRRAKPGSPGRAIDVSYPYFVVILGSASAGNSRHDAFYPLLTLFCAWAFWVLRSRRFHTAWFLASFAIAALLGYGGQKGLQKLQGILESKTAELFARFARKEFDPDETRTAMGHIGALKLSGRIVLRVRADSPPGLLRQSAYTTLHHTTWSGIKTFLQVTPETDVTTWTLLPHTNALSEMQISSYLRRGSGVLAIPFGSAELTHLPVGSVETNLLAVVRVHEGPGVISYTARYHPKGSLGAAPDDQTDLAIPPAERPAVAAIAQDLRLENCDSPEILRRIERFFQQHFTYTTYAPLPTARSSVTPLTRFLQQSRSGHCEYFASATVLLLRQAGIPARYATGYSVDPQDRKGQTYLVRERHAHAWALAWVNGSWKELDTTPGGWAQAEQKGASFWEPFSDFWAGLVFEFSRWRWLSNKELLTQIAPGLIAVLGAVLVWRLFARKRALRSKPAGPAPVIWPGSDSEMYQIEKALQKAAPARHSGETLSDWFESLPHRPGDPSGPALGELLRLHYRYRFDPSGLSQSDREKLRKEAAEWLARRWGHRRKVSR